VGAVAGLVVGVGLAVGLLWVGPELVLWFQGGKRLASENWVFYLSLILAGGFGMLTGAVVGAAGDLARAVRGGRTRPGPTPPSA
jgi:hypothetical protein